MIHFRFFVPITTDVTKRMVGEARGKLDAVLAIGFSAPDGHGFLVSKGPFIRHKMIVADGVELQQHRIPVAVFRVDRAAFYESGLVRYFGDVSEQVVDLAIARKAADQAAEIDTVGGAFTGKPEISGCFCRFRGRKRLV